MYFLAIFFGGDVIAKKSDKTFCVCQLFLSQLDVLPLGVGDML